MNISVIIPAYNAERTISSTIEAVQCQIDLRHQIEVIVVDDGSTDSTAEKLSKISGVKLIKQANRGPAAARNTGAKAAKGEILVFTDSDTVPHADWLQHLLEPFIDSKIMATGGTYTIANPGSLLARLIQKEIEQRHASYGLFIKFAGTYNLAIRESLFSTINGFDESYRRASGEDNDLCYRIVRCGYQIRYVAQAKVAHHHPEKLAKYMREQFRHGLWRANLYLNHPERITGDSYTGKKDALETFLCAGIEALLFFRAVSAILKKRISSAPTAAPAGHFFFALLCVLGTVECLSAQNLCKSFQTKLFACLVFSLRAFSRTTGFMIGLLYFSAVKLPKSHGYNKHVK